MLFVYHEEVGGASVVVVCGSLSRALRLCSPIRTKPFEGKNQLDLCHRSASWDRCRPICWKQKQYVICLSLHLEICKQCRMQNQIFTDQTIEIGGLQQTQIHLYKCPVRWWNRTL